jgi:DNA-binding transcriptional LysR family regulator
LAKITSGYTPPHRSDLKRISLKKLANENWVFLSRNTAPEMVADFTLLCANAGFSPRVINEPLSISAVLVMVAAGIGVSVAPGCVRSFHQPGVKFIPIQPDPPPMELVVARPVSEPPPTVATFLERRQLTVKLISAG